MVSRNNQGGFTLLETVLVIVIVTVLGLAVWRYLNADQSLNRQPTPSSQQHSE